MAEDIKQLVDLVAQLKVAVIDGFAEMEREFEAVDRRFDEVDKRFDSVETAIKELNDNQLKILNSIKLMEHDIKNNQNILKDWKREKAISKESDIKEIYSISPYCEKMDKLKLGLFFLLNI